MLEDAINTKAGNRMSAKRQDRLYQQVGELRDFSTAIIALGEHAPERMTLSQASFFLLTAMADILGNPTTFTDVRDASGPKLNRALHTTYKVLLDEGRMRDGKREPGIGWLTREANPADNRQKILKLTPAGREVIRNILEDVDQARAESV